MFTWLFLMVSHSLSISRVFFAHYDNFEYSGAKKAELPKKIPISRDSRLKLVSLLSKAFFITMVTKAYNYCLLSNLLSQ